MPALTLPGRGNDNTRASERRMNRVLVPVIPLLALLVVWASTGLAADDKAADAKSDGPLGTAEAVMTPIRDGLAFAVRSVVPPVTRGIGTLEDIIGDAYYFGHWVGRDYAAAARWYRRAAASGNALAQS